MQSLRNFFITFGISLVVFGILAWFIWGKVVSNDVPDDNEPVIQVESNDVVNNIQPDESQTLLGDSFTAVLCCYDDTVGRADSIVLVTVDKNKESFSVCPIPSYLKVDLGTETVKKEVYLGDILVNNGKNFFLQKLEALTGLNVDYYAFISNSDFVRMVNEIGGIEFDVPMNMYYRDDKGVELVNLKAGTTRLTGEDALELVRFRGYPSTPGITDDGDSARRKMHCELLFKVFETFLKPDNKESIEGIVKTLLSLIYDGETNFTATAFMRHKDLILNYENFKHETVEYPVSTTSLITFDNGESIAVHTPDVDRAVEKVFSEYNND